MIATRNAKQEPGRAPAELRRVLVFRGLPSNEHDPQGYARSLERRSHWTRDRRVEVTLRPLKYYYRRDASGGIIRDIHGRGEYDEVREKGIDVLCALAMVRESLLPDVDIVTLASTDSDLLPAIDEVRRLNSAKVETVNWWCPRNHGSRLRATPAVWNTSLTEADFAGVRDLDGIDGG